MVRRVNTKSALYRANRNAMITDLIRQGWTQSQVAERVNMSIAAISVLLTRERQKWLEQTTLDMGHLVAEEVAKLNVLEAEYWRAWERSVGEHTKITEKRMIMPPSLEVSDAGQVSVDKEETPVERTTVTDTLAGNPAFLQGVERCIEKRCKILGWYTGKGGTGGLDEEGEKYSKVNITNISVTYEAPNRIVSEQ